MSSYGKREFLKGINNKFYSIAFLESLFFIQNKWHQHGVFIHTLRVTFNIIKARELKFFAAALLHDIGKPFTAYKYDSEDIKYGEYSFTDHEEKSYQIIKNWSFISEYTKKIVRYHYLIRDLKRSKKEDLKRFAKKQELWDSLSDEIKDDLATFMIYDDLGKGNKRR